jgi:cell division protein FtsB
MRFVPVRRDQLGPWGWRLVAAAMVAALLAWVPWLVYESDGYVRLRTMQGQRTDLERGNERRRLENEALRRELRRLRHDPEALGGVARDELGLVRPGEIVLQLEGGKR